MKKRIAVMLLLLFGIGVTTSGCTLFDAFDELVAPDTPDAQEEETDDGSDEGDATSDEASLDDPGHLPNLLRLT